MASRELPGKAERVKSRPILFSSRMIKALLAGVKTQTRRVLKPQPPNGWFVDEAERREPGHAQWMAERCPYGVIGDKLWCRETFAPSDDPPDGYIYRADVSQYDWRTLEPFERKEKRWTSPLFMRRSQSRLELDITNVRVERLQDISEEDAKAEGVEPVVTLRKVYPSKLAADVEHRSYREGFADLWRSINGAESWDANPWVWVVEFRRLEQARSAA